MNRYEAQDFDLFAYNGDMTFINADDVGARINSIYDDFESRTCENCEYYSRIGACNNKESMMFDKLSFDSFCCNKWESKD